MNVEALARAQADLSSQRYAILPQDAMLGVDERALLEAAIFGREMERDLPHVHANRDRLDDVVGYAWRHGELLLSEANSNHADSTRIRINLTKNFATPRDYKRFLSLEIGPLRTLIEQVLRLVPDDARRPHGMVGIHAIRTYDQVVANWHRDGSATSPVDWVISYVLSRTGGGARSCLAVDQKAGVAAAVELAPGQLLMHRDDSFYHYVTPLISSAEVLSPKREVIVMMVRPSVDIDN